MKDKDRTKEQLTSELVLLRRRVAELEELEAKRKRAEEELRKLNQFRESIIDNANVWLNVLDEKGNILIWNKAAEKISGYSRHEVVGHGKIWEWLYPDQEYRNEIKTKVATIVEREDSETTIRRKDGQTRIISWNSRNLVDEKGAMTGSIAIGLDITGQKRMEVERALLQAERERLQQEVIGAQKRAIQELSTPIIPIMDRIIVMPLIGSIDSARARDITRALLAGIRQYRARVVIVDITGVPVVDTGVAGHLDRAIQAARLKGAHTIVTGISEAVAEAIVDLGIDWSGLETLSDLQTGLISALSRLGIKLSRADRQSAST